MVYTLLSLLCTLLCAPLLLSVINRVKAWVGGRNGIPLLQPYYDLLKLFGKGAVFSRSVSFVFKISPSVGFTSVLGSLLLFPQFGVDPFFRFNGDFILFIYLLGLMRFFMIIASLDTASSFEGMGASREAFFSMISEPVLLISFAGLIRMSGHYELTSIINGAYPHLSIPTVMIAAALFVVLLTENARIPVDDPNTHLELTMIHEVMVLDHSGPDLGLITYTVSLKLWIFCSLLIQVLLPVYKFEGVARFLITLGAIFLCAVAVGLIESVMARLRLIKVPQLLTGAGALAIIAMLFSSMGGL